jgi:hypothetical protein
MSDCTSDYKITAPAIPTVLFVEPQIPHLFDRTPSLSLWYIRCPEHGLMNYSSARNKTREESTNVLINRLAEPVRANRVGPRAINKGI